MFKAYRGRLRYANWNAISQGPVRTTIEGGIETYYFSNDIQPGLDDGGRDMGSPGWMDYIRRHGRHI